MYIGKKTKEFRFRYVAVKPLPHMISLDSNRRPKLPTGAYPPAITTTDFRTSKR